MELFFEAIEAGQHSRVYHLVQAGVNLDEQNEYACFTSNHDHLVPLSPLLQSCALVYSFLHRIVAAMHRSADTATRLCFWRRGMATMRSAAHCRLAAADKLAASGLTVSALCRTITHALMTLTKRLVLPQAAGADESIAANDGTTVAQVAMLRNRSGIAPEHLVTSLLASSLAGSAARSRLIDLIPLESQAKPESCTMPEKAQATDSSSQTNVVRAALAGDNVGEEEDKDKAEEAEEVHVGAGQSFIIDNAFDPAFLAKVDTMRKTLPLAPVRSLSFRSILLFLTPCLLIGRLCSVGRACPRTLFCVDSVPRRQGDEKVALASPVLLRCRWVGVPANSCRPQSAWAQPVAAVQDAFLGVHVRKSSRSMTDFAGAINVTVRQQQQQQQQLSNPDARFWFVVL